VELAEEALEPTPREANGGKGYREVDNLSATTGLHVGDRAESPVRVISCAGVVRSGLGDGRENLD